MQGEMFRAAQFRLVLAESQTGRVLRAVLLAMTDVENGDDSIASKPVLHRTDLLKSIHLAVITGEITGAVTFTSDQMAATIMALSHYENRVRMWAADHPERQRALLPAATQARTTREMLMRSPSQ